MNFQNGFDFTDVKNKTLHQGRLDKEMKKAIQYRINFFDAYSTIKNFKNYDVFLKELNKHRNPLEFYDYITRSDTMLDIFDWYPSKKRGSFYCKICKF